MTLQGSMTRLITQRFDTEVKMEDPIRYSSKKIRQIRKNCHDLILEMEKRIDGIRLIAGEDPSGFSWIIWIQRQNSMTNAPRKQKLR